MVKPKVPSADGGDGNEPAPAPVNDWAELRNALLAMQENIQATIHSSIQELNEILGHHFGYPQHQHDEENRRDNPFATEGREHHGRLGDHRQHAVVNFCPHDPRQLEHHRPHQDTRWENNFKVDIPELNGGIRGDSLLD